MDLRMPGVDGATAIRRLAERGIAVARARPDDLRLGQRRRAGASRPGATGYLLKDSPRDELFRAVRAAPRGESVLAPSVATRLVSQLRTRRPRTR